MQWIYILVWNKKWVYCFSDQVLVSTSIPYTFENI